MTRDEIEVGYGLWMRRKKPQWWPLMPGPLHDDVQFFNFHKLHRHVHPRRRRGPAAAPDADFAGTVQVQLLSTGRSRRRVCTLKPLNAR